MADYHADSSSKVLLVDPTEIYRDILNRALTDHGKYHLIHARNTLEARALIAEGTVGELAVVDIRFDHDAASLIRLLRGAGWARVIALAPTPLPVPSVLAAMQAGACGVVRVGLPAQPAVQPTAKLTSRELQVVRLVADGRPNKAIAQELSLSTTTVKNYLVRIARKLGAGDRAHIVAIACRAGVIPELTARRQP